MQLAINSFFSASVSARDVSAPSSSSNILFDQSKVIRTGSVIPFGFMWICIVVAKVIIAANAAQQAPYGREGDPVEQFRGRRANRFGGKN